MANKEKLLAFTVKIVKTKTKKHLLIIAVHVGIELTVLS